MSVSAGMMIKTEVADVAKQNKRKRKQNAEDNENSAPTSAKSAKIVKEKKLKVKGSNKNGELKNQSEKRSKSASKIKMTDGKKKKPENVRSYSKMLNILLRNFHQFINYL